MKLIKKRTDESYYYEGDLLKEVFTEEIKQYHYKDEKRKIGTFKNYAKTWLRR